MRHRHIAAVSALLAASVVGTTAMAHDNMHEAIRGVTPAGAPSVLPAETAFLAANAAAMDRMMAAMDEEPIGDMDADFTTLMIPHHQGAIDMAVTYLCYGRNHQLRRLAQEIIVEQQQEIAAMRLALGQPLPPSAPAPTQPDTAPAPFDHDHSAVSHNVTAGLQPCR
jgi:uncharacterized protein (DUF305 family)